jgi:excisionase family DNA binding protein
LSLLFSNQQETFMLSNRRSTSNRPAPHGMSAKVVLPMAERPTRTIPEAAALIGISRSKLYLEISAGRLLVCRIGGRRVIRANEIDRYLKNAET